MEIDPSAQAKFPDGTLKPLADYVHSQAVGYNTDPCRIGLFDEILGMVFQGKRHYLHHQRRDRSFFVLKP